MPDHGAIPSLTGGVSAYVAAPRPTGMQRTVAVVGLGAVGATAAYDLARWGADVTAFDAGRVASGSTGRAAGIAYDASAAAAIEAAGSSMQGHERHVECVDPDWLDRRDSRPSRGWRTTD